MSISAVHYTYIMSHFKYYFVIILWGFLIIVFVNVMFVPLGLHIGLGVHAFVDMLKYEYGLDYDFLERIGGVHNNSFITVLDSDIDGKWWLKSTTDHQSFTRLWFWETLLELKYLKKLNLVFLVPTYRQ